MLETRGVRLTMRFQILSDLHLEVGQQYNDFDVPPEAPYLILAGDIGRPIDYDTLLTFSSRHCRTFHTIFYVLGNHEFHGTSRSNGLKLAESPQQEPCLKNKLLVSNRTYYAFDDEMGPVVLGCTLHSRITPGTQDVVKMKIQDFSKIENWSISDHKAEHAEDVAWLQAQIARLRSDTQGRRRPILIITHHAPSTTGNSKPSDANNPWSTACATDLLGNPELPEPSDVHTWVFGHTHRTMQAELGGVKLISNQSGDMCCQKHLAASSHNHRRRRKRQRMREGLWTVFIRQSDS